MQIRVGTRCIGHGCPTFIVAEMSGNHGGKLERAMEIVRAAKRCGADAIKLQTYTANTITLRTDGSDFRIASNSPWAEEKTLWNLYEKACTPWDWHEAIFREARELGLEAFSSPFDETAVDLLQKLDAAAYKIASPEITHVPLLEKVAKTGRPVIVSTGVAEASDIELALAVLRDAGAREIVLLKCTTAYPAPPEEANLRTIPDMERRFGVLTGLSDHTIGSAVPIASVALGATVIEKHFELDGAEATVDSFFSMGEQEFSRMVIDVRLVERALGRATYEIMPSAKANMAGRRSLYISAPIKAGEKFTSGNIKCVRPFFGLHPKHFRDVIGRCARKDLKVGDRLTWDVIE